MTVGPSNCVRRSGFNAWLYLNGFIIIKTLKNVQRTSVPNVQNAAECLLNSEALGANGALES